MLLIYILFLTFKLFYLFQSATHIPCFKKLCERKSGGTRRKVTMVMWSSSIEASLIYCHHLIGCAADVSCDCGSPCKSHLPLLCYQTHLLSHNSLKFNPMIIVKGAITPITFIPSPLFQAILRSQQPLQLATISRLILLLHQNVQSQLFNVTERLYSINTAGYDLDRKFDSQLLMITASFLISAAAL